jgi:hypothetical protein
VAPCQTASPCRPSLFSCTSLQTRCSEGLTPSLLLRTPDRCPVPLYDLYYSLYTDAVQSAEPAGHEPPAPLVGDSDTNRLLYLHDTTADNKPGYTARAAAHGGCSTSSRWRWRALSTELCSLMPWRCGYPRRRVGTNQRTLPLSKLTQQRWPSSQFALSAVFSSWHGLVASPALTASTSRPLPRRTRVSPPAGTTAASG